MSGIGTFMENFCSASPAAPAADPEQEYGRDTQTQPYCDWTLALQAVTIIGLWSNVPSGGYLYPSQTDWLVQELDAAPKGIPLIVALHHPPYSVDAFHGGSAEMGAALDDCFNLAGRWPELVLSGHVHDYQRFTRINHSGKSVMYIVAGDGGYHNLHKFAPDAESGETYLPGVTFNVGDDRQWGFLQFTASGGQLTGRHCYVYGASYGFTDSFTVST